MPSKKLQSSLFVFIFSSVHIYMITVYQKNSIRISDFLFFSLFSFLILITHCITRLICIHKNVCSSGDKSYLYFSLICFTIRLIHIESLKFSFNSCLMSSVVSLRFISCPIKIRSAKYFKCVESLA